VTETSATGLIWASIGTGPAWNGMFSGVSGTRQRTVALVLIVSGASTLRLKLALTYAPLGIDLPKILYFVKPWLNVPVGVNRGVKPMALTCAVPPRHFASVAAGWAEAAARRPVTAGSRSHDASCAGPAAAGCACSVLPGSFAEPN